MRDWVGGVVWWHVYPLGFVGAPSHQAGPAVVHRLEHLLEWLDYAAELGVSGLALGPIFASESHGYDTVDHHRIDPRLGDDGDFDRLVGAARARGLRILLDGVFNHVGRGFATFQAAQSGGRDSDAARWFVEVAPDAGHPDGWSTFEGHGSLVELNHRNPEVAAHVARVMDHWLQRGAAGWRLDAAYAVPPEFWAEVLPVVRSAHPDAYIVGEVIHGDYVDIVARSGMDAATQYELWKAIWSSLNDRNLFELAWALTRHDALLDHFVPLTFVGNHDVTRLASMLDDRRHLAHAVAVLLTTGGTPSIYAGDEQAFIGVKEDRAGGDDAVRPAFPPTPAGLPEEGWATYRTHQELIAVRRRHPWLHRARVRQVHLTNTHLVYEAHGEGRLLVVLNVDDATAALPAPGAAGVEAGSATVLDDGAVEVPAHGWAVLRTG